MSRVPRLLPRQNLTSLPLTPAEGFLLSRIDGVTSERDIVLLTSVPAPMVAAALDRLAQLGAVDFVEETQARPERRGAGSRENPTPSSRMGSSGHSAVHPSSPSPPLYDPAELDEAVDLEAEKRRRILDLFYRLDDLTYYELLGVAEQVDKKQVKSAYYALAPEFHPDKFFRKNLGGYRHKIEAIFGRITLAHDVLTVAERRAEYDEYLETTHKNRAMSAMLDQAQRDVAAVEAAVKQAAAAALASQPGRYEAIAPANDGPQFVDRPSVPMGPPPQDAAEALRLRKEALARKLMGGKRPAPTPASTRAPPRPTEMDPEVAARAAEALRARHEAAVADAMRQQLQRHLDAGRGALDRSDFAAAANAYRIAASLAPDDAKVQATCAQAMQLAAAALAEGYQKQAAYEESQERWSEAALSYSKVCAGKPDNAFAHERVAYTTLRSGGNVRRAVEFARKAVELGPTQADLRITLARAYLAAGLVKSMNGELDRAVELGRSNPKIAAAAAQVRASAPAEGKVS